MTRSRCVHRPDHEVTVSMFFRALMIDRGVLPQLLAAGDDLDAGVRAEAERFVAEAGRRAE